MGVPKTKWTDEEEAALKKGVARYGVGKWRAIQKDEEFGDALKSRSNVDLKDKWRNIQAAQAHANGQPRIKRSKAKNKVGEVDGAEAAGEDATGESGKNKLKRADNDEAGPSGELRNIPTGYRELVLSAFANVSHIGDGMYLHPGQVVDVIKTYSEEEIYHNVKINHLQQLLGRLVEEGILTKVKRKGYTLAGPKEQLAPGVDDGLGDDATSKRPRLEDAYANGEIHCYPNDDSRGAVAAVAAAAVEEDEDAHKLAYSVLVPVAADHEPGKKNEFVDDSAARPPKKR